ncbi:MAG: proprotein convertase P-domain-containing protein, partial [Myxococcota bacterium]|nr:proprotein convertase P-domain-containing protein [Myxococcota bacterium]
VSNDLLTNQFVDVFTSANAPVPIPDAFGPGVSDTITVADVGIAQSLSVSVNISNGNLAVVTVRLFAPNGDEYVLFDKDNPGSQLGATYPTPNPTLSGDLTSWVGQNPAGDWVLNVQDQDGIGNQDDGQINDWSISIQTLSTKKVQVDGELHMNGDQRMGNHQIKELADPGETGDATNMGWVQNHVSEQIAAIEPNTYIRSGTVLTRWGSTNCPADFEKLHEGIAFTGHYTHSGSGNMLCVAPPGQGGSQGPNISQEDILYPVRLSTGGNLVGNESHAIRCSKCYTPDRAPCWRLVGGDTCPGDFEAAYSGFLFGSHYTHSNPMERICIDGNDFNASLGDPSNYMYATQIHS